MEKSKRLGKKNEYIQKLWRSAAAALIGLSAAVTDGRENHANTSSHLPAESAPCMPIKTYLPDIRYGTATQMTDSNPEMSLASAPVVTETSAVTSNTNLAPVYWYPEVNNPDTHKITDMSHTPDCGPLEIVISPDVRPPDQPDPIYIAFLEGLGKHVKIRGYITADHCETKEDAREALEDDLKFNNSAWQELGVGNSRFIDIPPGTQKTNPDGSNTVQCLKEIMDGLEARGRDVILNPGTTPVGPELLHEYNKTEKIIAFEGPFQPSLPDNFGEGIDPLKRMAVFHSVPPDAYEIAAREILSKAPGGGYITNETLTPDGNAYRALSDYATRWWVDLSQNNADGTGTNKSPASQKVAAQPLWERREGAKTKTKKQPWQGNKSAHRNPKAR